MYKFRNPVSPYDAPDPFMTYDPVTGYYYALYTQASNLELFRSRHAGSIITDGDSRVVYTANGERDGIWGDIWAPEMHRGSNGKWYIYTSGRIGLAASNTKRLFVVEGPADDPFEGEWIFRGQLSPDIFSIDPTVYTAPDGIQYLCCSRVDCEYGQVLDIWDLSNPYTYGKYCATIAHAELPWEQVPPYQGLASIVEGAFFLERNDRLFIIYSANGCWSDHYCLGVLEHTGGSLCDAANWKKHPEPLFVYGNGAFGPGHATFFKSPDGSEVWCAYHAMKEHNEAVTPTSRYFNIQKIDFDETGYPVMGLPVGYETEQDPPKGEIDYPFMTNFEFKLADAQCVNDNLPDMFSILYSNMNAIMPTGHSYEEDYAVWMNYAVPALQQENRKVVFFYADGDLIGYFQYRLITESSTLFMEEMQIRAEFQGSGVFSAFYSWLVRQLPASIQTVEALAGKPNQKSQAVLEHLGLQNVGENHTGKSFHYKGEYARLLERYLNEKQV